MTAEIVHNVAEALSQEEYTRLYKMIGDKLKGSESIKDIETPMLTDAEAQQILMTNIFSKSSITQRLNKMQS